MRQLVEAGSDINAQDIDGWTPLHVAVGAAAHNVFRVSVCSTHTHACTNPHAHVRMRELRVTLGLPYVLAMPVMLIL